MLSYKKIAVDLKLSVQLYIKKRTSKTIEAILIQLIDMLLERDSSLNMSFIGKVSIEDLIAILKKHMFQGDKEFRDTMGKLVRALSNEQKKTHHRVKIARHPPAKKFAAKISAAAAGSSASLARPAAFGTGRLTSPSLDIQPDDLSQIKGIGPTIKRQLNDLGIVSFKQISNLTPDEVKLVDSKLSFSGRMFREMWIQQAKGQVLNAAVADENVIQKSTQSASAQPETALNKIGEGELPQFGSLIYNPPSIMRVAKPTEIEVRIARELRPEYLVDLRGPGRRRIESIPIAAAMWVELHGDSEVFRIEGGLEKRFQFIDNKTVGYARWDWLVTPLVSGTHTLTLRFAGQEIRDDGTKGDMVFAPIDKNITVTINLRHTLKATAKWAGPLAAGAIIALLAQNVGKEGWNAMFPPGVKNDAKPISSGVQTDGSDATSGTN